MPTTVSARFGGVLHSATTNEETVSSLANMGFQTVLGRAAAAARRDGANVDEALCGAIDTLQNGTYFAAPEIAGRLAKEASAFIAVLCDSLPRVAGAPKGDRGQKQEKIRAAAKGAQEPKDTAWRAFCASAGISDPGAPVAQEKRAAAEKIAAARLEADSLALEL